MNKNVIMGVVAVLALGGAIFFLMSGGNGATADDAAEGLGQQQIWVCRQCNTDVKMTKQQWMDNVRAGTFVCPSCGGSDLQNAIVCPNCGQGVPTVGHGRVPSTCPRCNQPIGEWRDVPASTIENPANNVLPNNPG